MNQKRWFPGANVSQTSASALDVGVKITKRNKSWMANAVDTLEWFRACGLWDGTGATVHDPDPLQAVVDALNHAIGPIEDAESTDVKGNEAK